MSEHFYRFRAGTRISLVALGYDLDQRLAAWDALRKPMVRGVPEAFTRDEWAYLISFLERANLEQPFLQSFGERSSDRAAPVGGLFRARGPVAIWLPNNVSLLGPLVLLLASFTNAPICVKSGSRSDDLCQAFVDYLLANLPAGELQTYLREQVRVNRFGRDDARNQSMAAGAAVRIVFGSDAAAAAVHALPHPVSSVGISFADHRSEAWVEMAALDDVQLSLLMRVFAIYGQAGCTSPRRVVVLDGTMADCLALRRRMMALWPTVMKTDVPVHLASQNIMARQLAASSGWDAQLAPRHGAVLGVGGLAQPELPGLLSLAIVPATVEQAAAALPANIQTVGHCLRSPQDARWLSLLARSQIKRWVPVNQMHHFNAVWDGMNFWRQLFEESYVQA